MWLDSNSFDSVTGYCIACLMPSCWLVHEVISTQRVMCYGDKSGRLNFLSDMGFRKP